MNTRSASIKHPTICQKKARKLEGSLFTIRSMRRRPFSWWMRFGTWRTAAIPTFCRFWGPSSLQLQGPPWLDIQRAVLGYWPWSFALGVLSRSTCPIMGTWTSSQGDLDWYTGLSENGAPKITKDHLNILNHIGKMNMKHDMLLGDTIFRQGHVVSFCFTDSPWLFYPRFDFSMVMEGDGWTTMAPKLWLVTLAQRDLHWVFPEMTPVTETIYSTHRGYPLVIEYSYGTWLIYRGFSHEIHEICRVSQPTTFDHWSVSYFPQSWTVLKPCGWRQASDLHIATECCSPYP